MSLRKAAAYLDYNDPSVIEDLLRRGELRSLQITERGDRRIARDDLDSLIERRSKQDVKPVR